jgi:hypothetical protein
VTELCHIIGNPEFELFLMGQVAMVATSSQPYPQESHCHPVPCPIHSEGAGAGDACQCEGNYGGAVTWVAEQNMYTGACTLCNPVQGWIVFVSGGESMCVCMAGWTYTGTGCAKCAVGRYKPVAGNVECSLCETMGAGPGSTTRSVGLTSELDCVCNIGHYNRTKGEIQCLGALSNDFAGPTREEGDLFSIFQCHACPPCAVCFLGDVVFPAERFWAWNASLVDRSVRKYVEAGDAYTTGRQMFACVIPVQDFVFLSIDRWGETVKNNMYN